MVNCRGHHERGPEGESRGAGPLFPQGAAHRIGNRVRGSWSRDPPERQRAVCSPAFRLPSHEALGAGSPHGLGT